eukprot:c19505_g1_i1.p1 GENE.c19505_g1_i1~~c19505_g1_i1.p1  ORF type:complete len:525 (+),score=213.29 c19505_g1_i1:125-1699(+)
MSAPMSKISLSFSCRNIPKLDIGSNSDPMVVVFSSKPHISKEYFEVGRTEMIKDNHNPDFTTLIEMEYWFEESQPLRIVVVDVDNPKSKDLKKQDYIGSFETRLAAVITAPGQELTGPLKLDNSQGARGIITIRAEEKTESKQSVELHFAGEKLDSKDFFGKSDPFLKIFRARENGAWEAVHTTEVVKSNLNPVWKKFTIPVSKLCNGDFTRPLKFECHDWDSDGSTDFIGLFQTSLEELVNGKKGFSLVNSAKKKNNGVSGTIKVLGLNLTTEHSFLDYICGGCEISLITAIDFTASNGEPSNPTSLHYLSPNPTEYEKAIIAVGKVVEAYDSDGIIPTYGFGAKWNGAVNHCFPLVPNGCQGVEGILHAYRACISNVSLYGPTIFDKIIRTAAQEASQYQTQQNQHYTILLIITDGVISDMENAMRAIVDSSALPLSIVIVGVGPADFTEMNRLDSDDKLLSIDGRKAVRDIVQFVPFRDFVNQPYEALAKHTLAEIPTQFMAYMKSRGFIPNPPRQPSAQK